MVRASATFPRPATTTQTFLRLSLLGPPAITWNDIPVVIPRRSVRALLFRLACEPGPVTRDQLELLFWPDMSEEHARRNLSHHLTHLKRALPVAQVLVAEIDRVRLLADLTWCDASILREASPESETNLSRLEYMAELYHGVFLEGFSLPGCAEFETWCMGARQQLESQYLKTLECLVEALGRQGEINRAIHYAQKYLEVNPFSEPIHRRLIQLYGTKGERHLALEQYEQLSLMLEAELGVSPLPETLAAYQTALYQLSQPGEVHIQNGLHPLATGEIPLISREGELRKLDQAFEQMRSGQGQILLICGEAGSGKTRLMRAFSDRKQGQAQLLYGSGIPGEQGIPYQPLLGVVKTILMLDAPGTQARSWNGVSGQNGLGFADLNWLSEISRLLPVLRTHYPGLKEPMSTEPESAQTRLFDALCHIILAYTATRGPVMLCLEDLQWMDEATRAWLIHIGQYLVRDSCPLMILGSYRSEEAGVLSDLRHILKRAGVLTEIRLSGLTQSGVEELVRCLAGKRFGLDGLAKELHRVTGGNPFFVVEIIRKLSEEGKLLEYTPGFQHLDLPDSIHGAVEARLERLSAIGRQVLEAGAVLGISINLDLLRLTVGRNHAELTLALGELVAKSLLVETTHRFCFYDDIIRQCVYEGIGPVRRQLLHLRAARAYEYYQADACASLAYHFEMGGELQKALYQRSLSVRQAQEQFAWGTVEEHLSHMLDLLTKIDPGCQQEGMIMQRGVVLAERANIRYLQGQLAKRDVDLESLGRLGEVSNHNEIRLLAIQTCLRYLIQDGHFEQAVAVAKTGLELVSSSQILHRNAHESHQALSRLLAQIGFAYYFLGKPAEAMGVLDEAWSLCPCEASPEPLYCGRIQHILGYVYAHLGDHQRSLECQQQAYAQHKLAQGYDKMVWDLVDMGVAYKHLGRVKEAHKVMEEGLSLAEKVGSVQAKAYGLVHLGGLSLFEGKYPAAEAYFQQVLQYRTKKYTEHIISGAQAGMGRALYHQGQIEQSRSWLVQALAWARACGHRLLEAESLLQLGMLDLEAGDVDQARVKIDDGVKIAQDCQASDCQAYGLVTSAHLEGLAGRPVQALALAAEASKIAQQTRLSGCQMWAEIELGMAQLALGNQDSAMEHARMATSLAENAGQDWIAAEKAFQVYSFVLESIDQEGNLDMAGLKPCRL